MVQDLFRIINQDCTASWKLYLLTNLPMYNKDINSKFLLFLVNELIEAIDKKQYPILYRQALQTRRNVEDGVCPKFDRKSGIIELGFLLGDNTSVTEASFFKRAIHFINKSIYDMHNGGSRYSRATESASNWISNQHGSVMPDGRVDMVSNSNRELYQDSQIRFFNKLVDICVEHHKLDMEIGKLLYG